MKKLVWTAVILCSLAFLSSCAEGTPGPAGQLWPEIEPFRSEFLKVSEIHDIYFELCGNPKGKPVFVLHGGPGGSCSPYYRRFFNPEVYLVVLHDQRGAGRSRPSFELRENTTQDLVKDIERLRTHLELDSILLFGGSWGSTLALAYAETYPQHTRGMVLRGIFTAASDEIDHFYRGGVKPFFPETYARLEEAFGKPLTPRSILEEIQSGGEDQRKAASKAWTAYELKLSQLVIPDDQVERFVNSEEYASLVVSLAVIENHYMANGCFFKEGQLLENTAKIENISAVLVNGRYDMICPPVNAFRLHQRLPNSRLEIVEGAGHYMADRNIERALIRAMREFEEK